MTMRPLTDNLPPTPFEEFGYDEKSIGDFLRVSDIDINNLKSDNGSSLLVFPNSFAQDEQDLGRQSIIHLRLSDGTLSTGNIMGFVGVNDTRLTIKSRFAKEDKEDYFLHYLLMRVFNINLFDLKHTTASDAVFDFLMYMFPHFLKKALRQGLYKNYIRNEYNDSNVKGRITVNRHIRQNIPFMGSIAYETREFSYDNNVTQLVRHTIEYIKGTVIGQNVLRNDVETSECVSAICNATPTYSKNQRRSIMMRNTRPVSHPYFSEYTALQKICMRILRHESIKYGNEKDKVYGVLFDGAWLWEEYLNTFLQREGFVHPQNKMKKGGMRMFVDTDFSDKNYQTMYPDFYCEDFVLDAKYKHLNGTVGRDDLYQVVSYMYCMNACYGGYAYPNDGNNTLKKYKLRGVGQNFEKDSGGMIFVFPFDVPTTTQSWDDFGREMKESERKFIELLKR